MSRGPWTLDALERELSAAGRVLREEATLHASVDLCVVERCSIHAQPAAMRQPRAVSAHERSLLST